METIIEKISEKEEANRKIYQTASEVLKRGGLVAFPTETVYGLGADAMDAEAAAKVYAAKGRPSDNPLIVHICNLDALQDLAVEIPDSAYKLASRFWPGPLTMILKKRPNVPDGITGGLDTVAIRMPSHPVAARLIQESGVYIAAPSANTSGRPSPTKASHVIDDLQGKIDMIIADDTVDIGIESTIVDLSEAVPTILRPGYITLEMLQDVLGMVEIDQAIQEGNLITGNVVPKAPGMKYRHYAPKAELTIVEGSEDVVIDRINALVEEKQAAGCRVGIMATDESADRYRNGIVRSLGTRADESTVAQHLFAVLREFDDLQVDYIYSEGFHNDNVGRAVMNRLVKAAGHSILRVK